jgi:hypothetical protein
MNRIPRVLSVCLLLGSAGLYGCAGHQSSEQALQGANADFQKVKGDTNVLRSAPKDVIRAGELLAKAERMSGYVGSSGDVTHYAYLSSRYSAIASEHSQLLLNQEKLARLELERQRLQLDSAKRAGSGDDPWRHAVRHRSRRAEKLCQPYGTQSRTVPAVQSQARGADRGLHR